MFRGQDSKRTLRQNAVLAGYLALVAGYVNAVGLLVVGTVTSHTTGNVARFARELASLRFAESSAALLLVVAFFFGAFAASLILESRRLGRPTNAYGAALSLEAILLFVFVGLEASSPRSGPEGVDVAATLLGVAMGIQNSLVTRLSGAVVRTTHLTGVITDLGIESARWARWWRHGRSSDPKLRAERPSPPKIALLGTIALAFTAGALLGSVAGLAYRHLAVIVPALAVAAGAAYAFATRDAGGSVPPPSGR